MTGIAVVGLHRGGTSAVAGVLHHLGVFMGDQLLPPSPHNPKGYFEDIRFVTLHTKIMGGDWKFPRPDFMDSWEKYKDEYLSLVNEFTQHEVWGVKDPRLCHCLPLLRVATENKLKVLAVWRDPWEASHSLLERGGHTFEEAFRISISHIAAMLVNTWESAGVLYVPFDWLVGNPEASVAHMAGWLGLEFKQEAADFLDRDLVHHTDIPEWHDRSDYQPVACCPYCGIYAGCYVMEEHVKTCYKREANGDVA